MYLQQLYRDVCCTPSNILSSLVVISAANNATSAGKCIKLFFYQRKYVFKSLSHPSTGTRNPLGDPVEIPWGIALGDLLGGSTWAIPQWNFQGGSPWGDRPGESFSTGGRMGGALWEISGGSRGTKPPRIGGDPGGQIPPPSFPLEGLGGILGLSSPNPLWILPSARKASIRLTWPA